MNLFLRSLKTALSTNVRMYFFGVSSWEFPVSDFQLKSLLFSTSIPLVKKKTHSRGSTPFLLFYLYLLMRILDSCLVPCSTWYLGTHSNPSDDVTSFHSFETGQYETLLLRHLSVLGQTTGQSRPTDHQIKYSNALKTIVYWKTETQLPAWRD